MLLAGKRLHERAGLPTMPARPFQRAPANRSSAWRSPAESELPAESTTRIKQAPRVSDDETEAAIQASLSAALADLDELETAPPRLGMPPLPFSELNEPERISLPHAWPPPLPVSTPLAPPTPQSVATAPEPPLRRWPGIVAALLGMALVGAALWLSLVR
jgi:hypothetical protein